MLSGPSPSRPTASGFSPALMTVRQGCGTRRPAQKSRRSRDTNSRLTRSPSRRRQARPYRLQRPHGKAVGRSDRRRGRESGGTHKWCHRRRLLPQRYARSDRLIRQHGKVVGCGDRRHGRHTGGTHQLCVGRRLLARRQKNALSPAPSTTRQGCGTFFLPLRRLSKGSKHPSLVA